MTRVAELVSQKLALLTDAYNANAKTLITPVYNVVGYGANGDGVTNDSTAIQAAITAAALNGGGIVYFPSGTYLIGTTLAWTADNITLLGEGRELVTLREHSTLGANRIIFLQGTALDNIKNVVIRGLTIRNGTATTGSATVGKDGFRAEYVDGLLVEDCQFTEIEGNYGLVVKYAQNVSVSRTTFYRWTYSGMTVLVDSENIRVVDSVFDTAVSTTATNVYTFSVGAETLGEGTSLAKNVWIQRNRFLNNPRWEGIDAHGGENIWIQDNYVENCKVGINLACVTGYVSAPVLKKVTVEGNVIIQGTGQDNSYGISVQGKTDGSLPASDILIRNNKITGFGGTATGTVGCITASYARGVTIQNNTLDNYAQFGVHLYAWIQDARIIGNRFKATRASATPSIVSCIGSSSGGVHGVAVEDNTTESSDVSVDPQCFFYVANRNIGGVQFRRNTVKQVGTAIYANISYLPVERATIPTTNLVMRYGDVVLTDTGKPGWYVSAPKIGYGCLDTTSVIVTVNMTSGSTTATIVSGVTGSYTWLPDGINVTIAGAGAAGAALNARVLSNSGTSLVLDTAASTTVTGANLTYQALTLVT